MEFSWIQKHVLLVLIRQRTARVKDLLPQDMPANQFAYHLDGLVDSGVITKQARGTYMLTAKGQKLVGTFSTALDKQVENIKTVVLLYAKRGDEYLLFRWSRQPYLNEVTPLYDRVPLGKSLIDGINSALDDKLGERRSVTFKTSALVKVTHEDTIISHMNALVYEVDIEGVTLPHVSRNGEAFVGNVTTANVMDGVIRFFEGLDSENSPFDAEWCY